MAKNSEKKSEEKGKKSTAKGSTKKQKETTQAKSTKQATSTKQTKQAKSTKSSGTKKRAEKQAAKPEVPSVRPAPSTAEGLSDAQRKLIETIEDALPKLNEESLALIVRNCQVALYNDEMERTRNMVMEAQTSVEQGRVPGADAAPEVDIEQVSGQSFVIIFGAERVFFNRDELRQLTKVCWATDNAAEGARSMFRWMERERRDFLIDSGVDGPGDPGLQKLWSLIRSRYKAR